MIRRLLAIDPGVHIGFAVLDRDVGLITSGTDGWVGFPTVSSLLLTYQERGCDAVALEKPMFYPGMTKAAWALAETIDLTGYMRGRIEASGIRCIQVKAADWRQTVVGKRNPSNAEVKAALSRDGYCPRRSNEHERDAIGLGLHVMRTLGQDVGQAQQELGRTA